MPREDRLRDRVSLACQGIASCLECQVLIEATPSVRSANGALYDLRPTHPFIDDLVVGLGLRAILAQGLMGRWGHHDCLPETVTPPRSAIV